jgi:CRISPR-associated protein Csb3
MSETTSTISVNVDVTNPGQFFACCGLLELADRLWPGAEGWFDLSNGKFALCVAAGDGAAQQLINEIVKCPIEGLTPAERKELDELEGRKRLQGKLERAESKGANHNKLQDLRGKLRMAGGPLSQAEEARRSELGRLTREGHLILERFQLTLDWWQEDGAPATWAGKQEIHKIARAAQDGIAQCMAEGRPLKDMLDWQLVLRTPSEYRSKKSKKGTHEKVEPFYFDARRYAHRLDAGFSLDVQSAHTVANPATEFLCLVGLQRFRPKRAEDSRWTFEYCAWGQALGVAQAAPAASGLVRVPPMRRFCFPLQFRDDQERYYKAFGFARPMGGS